MALGQSAFTKIEASSGTSTSAALSRTPTSGNTIVVGATAYWASGSTPTALLAVSGATNGTYTAVGRTITGNSVGADDTVGLFYHTNVAATAETVTITGGAGTSGVVGLLTELTGYTSQTVDVGGTPAAAGTGTTATSTALTNSHANAIYVAAVGDNSTGAMTPGSSFTSSSSETNGASFPVLDLIYLVVSSAASRTATETLGSANWAIVIAAFSDTPGGAAVQIPYNPWPQLAPLLAT